MDKNPIDVCLGSSAEAWSNWNNTRVLANPRRGGLTKSELKTVFDSPKEFLLKCTGSRCLAGGLLHSFNFCTTDDLAYPLCDSCFNLRQHTVESEQLLGRCLCDGCFDIPYASGSPIEQTFMKAHWALRLPSLHGLVQEHWVQRYRIDFALPARKFGIELDGFRYHSSTKDIADDRKRQRALEHRGWRIVRFGGAEVHDDVDSCVREAARFAAL